MTPRIDIQFALAGETVPADYADGLWQALQQRLPWLETETGSGVHPLAWVSPGDGVWYLSGRSRLTVRVPVGREEEVERLSGCRFEIAGHSLALGAAKRRPLAYAPVLYAKFVTFTGPVSEPTSEESFLAALMAELTQRQIAPKFICGKPQRMQTSEGMLSGFSLMLYDLPEEANLAIQYEGLGLERRRGCGIFVPHKPGSIVADH